jgi:hypothetical protein
MSTNYKAQLNDVITIRQAVERVVVYLGRRGGWFPVTNSEADALGQTHFRPKEWTTKAKDLLANAFVSGEVNLLVRLPSDVPSFEPIPPEKLSLSKSFRIALPGEKIIARTGDSLFDYDGRDVRVSRAQFEKWLLKCKRLLLAVRRQGSPSKTSKRGRPAQQLGRAIAISNELFPGKLITRGTPREAAAQIFLAARTQHATSISLSTAQRAVNWRRGRRSARR